MLGRARGSQAADARMSDAHDAHRKPMMCLFSKPLHNRTFDELPAVLEELGIDAVDLTCRPGGHVLPERAADDLPRAYEALQKGGIAVPMITTGILDADKDHAEMIVKTAAALGIRHAKLGYYKYGDLRHIDKTLADVKSRLRGVAALCKQYGVRAGFHNHAGMTVGAALWDVHELIHDLPSEAIGSYFDIRHATVEGGKAGWKIGMHRLAPRIAMVAVKDFRWYGDRGSGWHVVNVPLGTGMVREEEAYRTLKELRFAGPISLHMEYMAGGQREPKVDSDEDRENLTEIRSDWRHLKAMLEQAELM